MATIALEECTVDHVVKALNQRKNAGPATLKDIKKALPKPLRQCDDALAEAVRDGRVWQYGNKGADEVFWTQSPTDYAFNVVEQALQKAASGVAEKVLIKKIDVPLLNGLVNPSEFIASLAAQSRIFALPKKGKGDVKYGLEPIESPEVLAWAAIENKLRQSPDGLTESELANHLKEEPHKGAINPKSFLGSLVSAGRIYVQPNAPSKKDAKYTLEPYWTQARVTAAFARAEDELRQTVGGMTENDLISQIDVAALDGKAQPIDLLQYLVGHGRLFVQPSVAKTTKKGTKKYTLQPYSYVDVLVEELVANVTRLANENNLNADIALERVRELLTGKSASTTVASPVLATPPLESDATLTAVAPVTPVEPDSKLSDLILQAMREVNPRADDGDLVLIRELRQRLDFHQIEKSAFDRTLLGLFAARKVILSKTSAGLVSDEDRQVFVADDEGNYYNTVAYWKAS